MRKTLRELPLRICTSYVLIRGIGLLTAFLVASSAHAVDYFSTATAVDPNNPSSWQAADNSTPANFANPADRFIVQPGHTLVTTAAWNVGGTIVVASGAVLTFTQNSEVNTLLLGTNTDIGGVLNVEPGDTLSVTTNLEVQQAGGVVVAGRIDGNGVLVVGGNISIPSGSRLEVDDIIIRLSASSVLTVAGVLDFINTLGRIFNGTTGTTTLAMQPTGLIRTKDPRGLGPEVPVGINATASLRQAAGGSWDLNSISTNGTVEYYNNEVTVNRRLVTARTYNNLLITGTNVFKEMAIPLDGIVTVNGNLTLTGGNFAINTANGPSTDVSGGRFNVLGSVIIDENSTMEVLQASLEMANGNSITVEGTLDFADNRGFALTGNAGVNALTVGENGTIRTRDLLGLGPNATGSLRTQGSGIWNTSSISTTGTVAYYNDQPTTNTREVTDRDYHNLVISGQSPKEWTLSESRTISGDLTITGTTLLVLGGQTLDIEGNLVNNGTLSTGSAPLNLSFSGAGEQTISGTATPPLSVNNLTVNKSGGSLTLGLPVSVAGQLALTSGIVNTSATNLLSLTSSASFSGTPSNGSHINGPLQRTGTSAFTFPVGKNGKLVPISVGAAAAANTFTAEYFPINAKLPPRNGNLTAPGLLRISECEYWQLDRSVGSSPVSVTIGWGPDNACPSDIYMPFAAGSLVAYFDGTAWSRAEQDAFTSSVPNTGTVTMDDVNDFGPFTLGSSSNLNALPITFGNFTATQREGDVVLNFSNFTEEQVDAYHIERSADGITFQSIGTLQPQRNDNTRADYTYLDKQPLNGNNYYRIKGVETTSKVVYSSVVKVQIMGVSAELVVAPNPARANTSVNVQMGNLPAGNYMMRVFNQVGQLVHTVQFSHTGGNVSTPLPAQKFQSGRYILELNGTIRRTASFLIQ